VTAINMIRRFGELALPPNAAITGGLLIIGVSVSGVDTAEIAGAGALTVLGVSLIDADTDADIAAYSPIAAWPAADRLTIGAHGEFPVTYAANCNVGVWLVAAAAGKVTPYTAGTSTFDQIVGYCTQTTTSGNIGAAYIGRG
jgi:hypothetical protein